MADISLIPLDDPRIPLLRESDISDNALLYVVSGGVSHKTYAGYLRNWVTSQGLEIALPPGNEGDGILFEGGDWIARPIDYSDIQNVPQPARDTFNIDVDYLEQPASITVNPTAQVRRYVINSVEQTLSLTYTFPIDPLVDELLSRYDIIVLREFGVIEFRKGNESDIPTIPGISGDELILVAILRTASGYEIVDVEIEVENGISESGGKIGLGGTLVRNTLIDSQGFDFSIVNSQSNLITGEVLDLRGEDAGYSGRFVANNTGVLISFENVGGDAVSKLTGTGNTFLIDFKTSADTNALGSAQYARDFSSVFVDRSLPDVGWVNNQISDAFDTFVLALSDGQATTWNAGNLSFDLGGLITTFVSITGEDNPDMPYIEIANESFSNYVSIDFYGGTFFNVVQGDSSISVSSSSATMSYLSGFVQVNTTGIFLDTVLETLISSTNGIIVQTDPVVSSPSAGFTLFSDDYMSLGDSPYVITQDGEVINIRKSSRKTVLLEYNTSAVNVQYLFLERGQTIETVNFDSNVISSVVYSAREAGTPADPFVTLSFSDLNAYLNGANNPDLGTLPLGFYAEIQVECIFQPAWTGRGQITLEYKPQ